MRAQRQPVLLAVLKLRLLTAHCRSVHPTPLDLSRPGAAHDARTAGGAAEAGSCYGRVGRLTCRRMGLRAHHSIPRSPTHPPDASPGSEQAAVEQALERLQDACDSAQAELRKVELAARLLTSARAAAAGVDSAGEGGGTQNVDAGTQQALASVQDFADQIKLQIQQQQLQQGQH